MAYLPILKRRRQFKDEWSNDDGATWIETPLERANFQDYIEKDFTDTPATVNVFRRLWRWWIDDGL
jgi:hypothetical protein